LDGDLLGAAKGVGGFGGIAVDADEPGFDPLLEAGAGKLGEVAVEKMIEALAAVGGGGLQVDHPSVILNEIRLLETAAKRGTSVGM
jgi:hypothetical protein